MAPSFCPFNRNYLSVFIALASSQSHQQNIVCSKLSRLCVGVEVHVCHLNSLFLIQPTAKNKIIPYPTIYYEANKVLAFVQPHRIYICVYTNHLFKQRLPAGLLRDVSDLNKSTILNRFSEVVPIKSTCRNIVHVLTVLFQMQGIIFSHLSKNIELQENQST